MRSHLHSLRTTESEKEEYDKKLFLLPQKCVCGRKNGIYYKLIRMAKDSPTQQAHSHQIPLCGDNPTFTPSLNQVLKYALQLTSP